MKWIYEEELYNGFFARIATTPSKQVRFSRYARIMLDWATTRMSETAILRKHNYSGRGAPNTMTYIKKMCKKLNPKLFQACERLRRDLKSNQSKLKPKVDDIERQSRRY